MKYVRRVGDIPLDEFLSALDEIVEKDIENTLKKFLPTLENYINAVRSVEKLSTTKQLCNEMHLSRQTLNNWYKREDTKKLLEGTKQKIGNKNMYRLNAVREIVNMNERVFGKDRYYKYKHEVLTPKLYTVNKSTQEIINKDLSKLTLPELYKKVNSGFELSEEESKFLRKNDI